MSRKIHGKLKKDLHFMEEEHLQQIPGSISRDGHIPRMPQRLCSMIVILMATSP